MPSANRQTIVFDAGGMAGDCQFCHDGAIGIDTELTAERLLADLVALRENEEEELTQRTQSRSTEAQRRAETRNRRMWFDGRGAAVEYESVMRRCGLRWTRKIG